MVIWWRYCWLNEYATFWMISFLILLMMRLVCTMVQPIMVFDFLNLSKLSLSRGNKHSSACFLIQITVLVDTQILWPHPNQMSSYYASSSRCQLSLSENHLIWIFWIFVRFNNRFTHTHENCTTKKRNSFFEGNWII